MFPSTCYKKELESEGILKEPLGVSLTIKAQVTYWGYQVKKVVGFFVALFFFLFIQKKVFMQVFDSFAGEYVDVILKKETKQTVSFSINDKLNFANFLRDNYNISDIVITMTNDSFDIEYEQSEEDLIGEIKTAVMAWNACFNLKETKNGK